ncbi:hypothetical protein BJ165DRAFT_927992 [Panaeolus papilionaceus]|nr:hypothetical protein BJ165DRAFT_927992 [Panaeolus papilionaceus]
MENSIFPVEIFELIIDQHQNMDDRDRSEDLKRFCSVSKGFRQICEPYIFRTISINTEVDYLPTIRKLVNLLVQQPRLSTYIRCMSFTLQGDTRDPSTALPDLPCLPMLEDLQISSRYRTISYSKILYPSGTLEYHLPRHCLSSSTVNLRRVGLCSIDAVPILHILSFPQLEVLDLTYCLLDYETQPSPSVSDSTVFSVRKLVILRTTNFRPSTLHMCSQLEEFRFHPFFPIHTDDITPPTGVNLSLFFRALRALDCYANFDWSAVCGADGATSQKAFPALTTLVLHTGSVRNMDHVNCIFNHFDILEVIDLTISRSNSKSDLIPSTFDGPNRCIKHLIFRFFIRGWPS